MMKNKASVRKNGVGLLAALTTLAAAGLPAAETPTYVPENLFSVPDGLEVSIWARSPMLRNPTNMDIDKDGRIWVAEGANYRRHNGRSAEGDRIQVLEDTNGDGEADRSWTFVQEKGLVAPLGVAVFDNKVVVSQTPDLIVYTDVNRNLRFDEGDKREVILTGFNGANHDHSLHSVYAGPDGKWYFSAGNCGALVTDKSGKTFRIGSPYNPKSTHKDTPMSFDPREIAGQKSDDGHVYIGGFVARMNPDATNMEVIGHNFRNSYEQTVTSIGDVFQNDNDDPPACRVAYVMDYGNAGFASADGKRSWRVDQRPGQTTQIAEWRQEDPGTMPAGDVYGGGSPTGIAYYENGALGEKWRGLLLSCEAGRNVVFGYQPKPKDAGFQLDRTDFLTTNKDKVFFGSDFIGGGKNLSTETHILFRPSDVAIGPDGAIYVSDWFDPRVGGHSDRDETMSGAIYRIAPKGFKSVIPQVDYTTTEGQIAALKSPTVNVRHTGFTRLKAKGDKVLPQVRKVLKEKNPYVASRAVWLMAQLGDKGRAQVKKMLGAKNPERRLVAMRALLRAGEDPAMMAIKMAGDSSRAIQRESALALRDVDAKQAVPTLSYLATRFDGKDRHMLEAIGTGASGKETQLYKSQEKRMGTDVSKWTEAHSWLVWRLGAFHSIEPIVKRALLPDVGGAEKKRLLDALAFINGKKAAMAVVDLASNPAFPFKAEAMWWLFNRKNNDWSSFNLDKVLKDKGLYDPAKIELAPVVMPEVPDAPSKLPKPSEIAKLKGDAVRGKQMAVVCYTCHRFGSQGQDFGPDLTEFGKTQTREVLIQAITQPSADIAHGFDGSILTAKDGTRIDGMVISSGDPTIIRSMGGQTQVVPKGMIKSVKKMNKSLMFSGEMLGLDAQAVADVVAYLQSGDIK